ncbi:MAG: filamentous hemagglutinin N-terminal domain-containing protein, partial [Oscillatoria sp. SIO1A7]|nr:filamentous hemagglutinin N-terminal domain-containing protein [Oscillatoria sp. SIO1A7]
MKQKFRESENIIFGFGKSDRFCQLSGLSLLAALILAAISPSQKSQAQPITPAADGTNTVIEQNGNQFDITGGSLGGANLFHSFEKFSLDANQTANFLATPDLKNILGRVVGGNPSIINGLIQVTGGNPNLFLMNPAGVLFGPNASLNLPASFFATTANGIGFGDNLWFGAYGSNDYGALVGEPNAFSFSGINGALANFGDLRVNPGETISFSGSSVFNAGTLTAPGGEIIITAVSGTNTILLSQAGHLLSLEIDASNLTNLEPTNLRSLLANSRETHASQVTLNTDGTVTLGGSTIGSSLATLPTGTAIVAGNLDVSTERSAPDSIAGTVGIFGQELGIAANIDASGTGGGGSVFIGGEALGGGSLPRALYTFVGKDTIINADATNNGDGGSVVVWADKNTIFNGNILTRGGVDGGDGGFVETSGKIKLEVGSSAVVDASAALGQGGQWLLDPSDITISASGDVTPATIETSLNNGTDVTITTAGGSGGNGDITASEAIAKTAGGEATLTLEADRDININSGANITSSSDKLNVVLDATGGINITGAAIATNGGNFTATATGLGGSKTGIAISNSTINAGSGNISLTGTSGSSSDSNNDGVRLSSAAALETDTGAISITGIAGAADSVNDGVEIDSASVRSDRGSIAITGTGGGSLSRNRGILVKNGTIESTGAGSISLTGTGSSGQHNNDGIVVEGAGSRIAASGTGNITLEGRGGNATDTSNDGIRIFSGAALETTEGRISITGTGGSGTHNNDGLEINSSSVSSGSGAIEITGTGGGNGVINQGIQIS